MNQTHATLHIDVADTLPRRHCEHADGTTTFALLDPLGRNVAYVNGALEQVREFALALVASTYQEAKS